MKKTLLALAILPFFAATAYAEIPTLDSTAYCQKLTAAAGGSEQIAASCKEQEALALENLKKTWEEQPETVRTQCQQITASAAGGYTVLSACADQFAAAAKAGQLPAAKQ